MHTAILGRLLSNIEYITNRVIEDSGFDIWEKHRIFLPSSVSTLVLGVHQTSYPVIIMGRNLTTDFHIVSKFSMCEFRPPTTQIFTD